MCENNNLFILYLVLIKLLFVFIKNVAVSYIFWKQSCTLPPFWHPFFFLMISDIIYINIKVTVIVIMALQKRVQYKINEKQK
jgi:hypothetical protein